MSGRHSTAASPEVTSGVAALRAKARTENFPVASYLLPSRYRRHLMAVYTFARLVDDIGDEFSGDRAVLLDAVTRQLDLVFSGEEPTQETFAELADTVRACGLEREPFDLLVEANRQDQVVSRYTTFQQLARYCEHSANPVGALVLGVFGADRTDRRTYSDRICTALQLLEHIQDVAEDYAAGRVYLPAEDLERFDVTESEFAAAQASRSVRALIGYQVQRAMGLLEEGAGLLGTLPPYARVAVAGYLAGGFATAEALGRAGFDVLGRAPRASKVAVSLETGRLLKSGSMR